MSIAVTGGTGMVGHRLVQRLRARGTEVTIVSRTPGGRGTVTWEPTQPGSLELPETTEAVVHLAGAPIVASRWDEDYKREIRQSRVQGTQTLVEAIDAHGGIGHLVSGSAVGYYGDRGDQRLTEQSPPGQGFLANVCQAWEAQAQEARKVQGSPSVALVRTGVVLSPEDGALAQMLNPFSFVKPFHWGLGGPLGLGKEWFPWIHIEDEVRAILHILDEGLEGPFNLTAPNPVTNKTFTKALGRALRRPAVLPIPKLAIKMLYGEAADLLYDSQMVVPERLEEHGFAFEHGEIGPAMQDLLG